MEHTIKILFVCLGNICRSPLAEGIFRKKIMEKGLSEHFEVDSCGTSDYHIGDQPDQRTRDNALKHELKLSHRARQISLHDLNKFDYILVMDRDNLIQIKDLFINDGFRDKYYLLRSFEMGADSEDVPDPYFGGAAGFENVYQIIDRATEGLINYLQKANPIQNN